MTRLTTPDVSAHRPSRGATAADLMTPNPVSLQASAPVHEAVAFLTDTGYSAAPVIDDAGRAIGVISRTDIVVHDRARLESLTGPSPEAPVDTARVRDLMTPTVFAVAPEVPATEAARRMADCNVHRLFVVDRDGILVGVLSALDLLRHLCRGPGPEEET